MALGDIGTYGYFGAGGTGETATTPGWGSFGAMPAAGWGANMPLETIDDFTLSGAQRAWELGRLGQMGNRAALPQFQQTAGYGFAPAYGAYLAGGSRAGGEDVSFADWLNRGATGIEGTEGYVARPAAAPINLANALAASAQLASPGSDLTAASPEDFAQQTALRGTLSGANARANQIALMQAALGGGVGMGANARARALGNIYDLYAARQAATGGSPGGFLNWIASRAGLA